MRKTWIKLWVDNWLSGSMRFDLTSEERGVWADLLAMAGHSRNPGIIQADADMAYPHEFLAASFNITIELLETTLQKCADQGRISENSHGIEIMKWAEYQTVYDGKGTDKKDPKIMKPHDPSKYKKGPLAHLIIQTPEDLERIKGKTTTQKVNEDT